MHSKSNAKPPIASRYQILSIFYEEQKWMNRIPAKLTWFRTQTNLHWIFANGNHIIRKKPHRSSEQRRQTRWIIGGRMLIKVAWSENDRSLRQSDAVMCSCDYLFSRYIPDITVEFPCRLEFFTRILLTSLLADRKIWHIQIFHRLVFIWWNSGE